MPRRRAGFDPDSVPEAFAPALRSAFNILDYGDNTERKLREKLARKGFAPDAVDFAVGYVASVGLLDDARYLADFVDRLARVKLYGKRRIVNEAFARGFPRELIESFDFDGYDFPALAAERMRKTAARYPARDKLYASLIRAGFSPSDFTLASQLLASGEED